MAASYSKMNTMTALALKTSGYELINEGTYKAMWSTAEVEHFIYLRESEKMADHFYADFGIKNPAAERFSCNVIHEYGGEAFKFFRCGEPTSCAMRFSFGRLERSRWPMSFVQQSGDDFIFNLSGFVEARLMPEIRHVTSLHRFFSILTSDIDTCPWVASNGAIRAAQIVAIAGQLGIGHIAVRECLKSRTSFIAHGGPKSSLIRSNPIAFIEKLFDDWGNSYSEIR